MSWTRLIGPFLLSLSAASLSAFIDPGSWISPDHPAINYWNAPLQDPVTKLEEKLRKGETKLSYSPGALGYLPALLKALDVNRDSQMLVFSKTSFQASKISYKTPRALYFNDNVAIGFVPDGDVYELISLDPRQGPVFFTLDVHASEKPGFARRDVCLQCHHGPATLGVPGIFISSVYPGRSDIPAFRAGAYATDHRSDFEKRWGGWFVSGTHGSQHHMGNAVAPDSQHPDVLEFQGAQNLTSLEKRVDLHAYLANSSDIVALMTYEHQTRMTNLLTRLGWQARVMAHDKKTDDVSKKAVEADLEELINYLVFADEITLREPVAGVSTFSKTFPERGPRDSKGRSLHDFDVKTRLFRYPLSYMIYNPAFENLPPQLQERVYRRMFQVLTGEDRSQRFGRLDREPRQAALEILRETKTNRPEYFKMAAAQ